MDSFKPDAAAVQSHLEMLQGVIQRMAESSRSCKLWSITVLSAVLFFAARTGVPWYTLLAIASLFLFVLLDVYYLSLERRFRSSYTCMLEKLREGTYGSEDVYQISPSDMSISTLVKCLLSPSIYLYYPLASGIAGVVFAVQVIQLRAC